MNLREELDRRVTRALVAAGAAEGTPAIVNPAARPEFGDYQANGVMAAARAVKSNPRQLAQAVVDRLDLSDLAEAPEIAGPGFLNIRLRGEWVAAQLSRQWRDDRLGVQPPATPQTVIVDYCGPNLAKEMHVGHLRSTIIGDALARVLEFTGQEVIRQSHVGDWGTQFGMLIAHMNSLAPGQRGEELADLEAFYQAAKQRFDEDPQFAALARQYVVRLQGGDEEVLESWRGFIDTSLTHCDAVCERLNTTVRRAHVRGESAYNEDLANVIADLERAGMLSESQGAQCVFLDGFVNKQGEPLPVIVRKSDGGYLYATTDLAALRYRGRQLQADRILYVTDARQALHFQQVFTLAKQAGFVDEHVSLEHVPFGMMLGADGKPFKTRTGGTVKLMDLIAEAQTRALAVVDAKSPHLPPEQRQQIARVVGIGAMKYADLSQNRTSDYVFSWDKMLSLEGNTAPYMQYAYSRIRSIFRKAGVDAASLDGEIRIARPAERTLGVKLLQFPETIQQVAREAMPNVLCAYLYDLAGAFMGFYEHCPVIQADDPAERTSRLALCDLTARTVRTGLNLLGIDVVEQM